MIDFVDVSKFERDGRLYDGRAPKFGIVEQGVHYIVKCSEHHLVSEACSEVVASRFIQYLGVPSQEAWLRLYNGEYVSIVKNFCESGEQLKRYCDLNQSSVDTQLRDKEYTYSDVCRVVEAYCESNDSKELTLKSFWDMFTVDAILGNRDRHWGNWGFLKGPRGTRFAPLFDNGGSLFPEVSRVIDNYVNNPEHFVVRRSEYFPASLFLLHPDKNQPAKRTNYKDIFRQIKSTSLSTSLSLDKVYRAIVYATEGVDEPYKSFYIETTCTRYLSIVCGEEPYCAYGKVRDLTCGADRPGENSMDSLGEIYHCFDNRGVLNSLGRLELGDKD